MLKKDQGGLNSALLGLKQTIGIEDQQHQANAKRIENFLQPGLHIDEPGFTDIGLHQQL
jgi:hypothetical protein